VSAAAGACDACLARPWLLARLSGHLDRVGGRIQALLALPDQELIEAIGGRERSRVRGELAAFEPDRARRAAAKAGLELVCRCEGAYPRRLLDLQSAPAVLHLTGATERLVELAGRDPVAVVGARRPSAYGLDMARALGRGLDSAGVTVLSGMADGIDAATHAGSLDASGGTIAVLPGSAAQAYPAGKRRLHERIVETGVALSELGPGVEVRRWMFPARNRLIAALAAMTVVVEASERSGALITAELAAGLERGVGAVPGAVTSRCAAGPNELLARGATLIRGAQDVLDCLYGAGCVRVAQARGALPPGLQPLLAAIGDGRDTAAALSRAGLSPQDGLAALASLELAGYIRRTTGGRYSVLP
jgi:DNA processing protein